MRAITVLSLLLAIPLASCQFQNGFIFPNVFNQQQQQQQQQQPFFNNPFFQQQQQQQQQGQGPTTSNYNNFYQPFVYPQDNNQYLNNFFFGNQNQGPPVTNQNGLTTRATRATTTGRPITTQNSSFRERISERKCKEYTNMLGGEELVMSLSLDATVQKVDVHECKAWRGLVIGGENATAGEFPHMAAIGYPEGLSGRVGFYCGGTLISERFVLTAAHCRKVGREKPTLVRLGELNLKVKDAGLPELDVPVEEFKSHEQYKDNKHKNDIALIRLRNNVPFSKVLHPACLAQPNLVVMGKPTACGWGFIEVAGPTADHLQKVALSIIENNECAQYLRKQYTSAKDHSIDNTQMCAGELVGGKDTCGGDSGGPLQIPFQIKKCMYTVIGITSYGTPFCGEANSPGVYTRVSAYLDWIEQRVWGTQ